MVRVQCPKCGGKLRGTGENLHRHFHCPGCKCELRIASNPQRTEYAAIACDNEGSHDDSWKRMVDQAEERDRDILRIKMLEISMEAGREADITVQPLRHWVTSCYWLVVIAIGPLAWWALSSLAGLRFAAAFALVWGGTAIALGVACGHIVIFIRNCVFDRLVQREIERHGINPPE